MKKIIFSLIAAVVIILCSMCATGSNNDDHIRNVIHKLYEGYYYEEQFEHFKARRIPRSGFEPYWIKSEIPSERDIDRAIAAFEEALRMEPSGTWTLPRKYPERIHIYTIQHQSGAGGASRSTLPPEGGIQAQLERAQKTKQDWVTNQELLASRAFIELNSGVPGVVLLNNRQTSINVTDDAPASFSVFNADGLYNVAVRDSNGVIHNATEQFNLSPGMRVHATVYNNTPNNPDDFRIIQNTQGSITITGYPGTRRNVVIPETIHGVRVTEIASNAFPYTQVEEVGRPREYINAQGERTLIRQTTGKPSITSVVIPNTVTRIGAGAFGGNADLIMVVLPNSITTIEQGVFAGCQKLRSITIPNSVTTINERAFMNSGLTSVTLPNRLTTIGDNAFAHNQLSAIELPSTLRTIGERAFFDNKLTNLTIPNGITLLKYYSFGKNPIASLVIPPSLARFDTATGVANVTGGFPRAFADENRRANETFTRITIPANLDERNLENSFEVSFVNFWRSQNRAAGTYIKNGQIWTRQ